MGEDEDGEDVDAGAVVRRLRRAPAVVRALKCLVCDAWGSGVGVFDSCTAAARTRRC